MDLKKKTSIYAGYKIESFPSKIRNKIRLLSVTTFSQHSAGSEGEVAQSCLTLCDPMDSSLHQAPPSMGFSRQEYWSGLPFPSPGNLPNPGIEPRSLIL